MKEQLMQEGEIAAALRETFLIILKLGAVPLLAVLAVGLVVSLFQAVTQISEQTLAFVPKLLTLAAVLALSGHFLFSSLSDYALSIFDRVVAVGGS